MVIGRELYQIQAKLSKLMDHGTPRKTPAAAPVNDIGERQETVKEVLDRLYPTNSAHQ
jgi:hypothetical protein